MPFFCSHFIQSYEDSFHLPGLCRVVEAIEVVHHELYNLKVIIKFVVAAFRIVLDVFQLDGAGVLPTFALRRKNQECHVPRNVPS